MDVGWKERDFYIYGNGIGQKELGVPGFLYIGGRDRVSIKI